MAQPTPLRQQGKELRGAPRSLRGGKLVQRFQQLGDLVILTVEIRQRYAEGVSDQPCGCNGRLMNAQLVSADSCPAAGLIDPDEYA